MIDTKLRDDAVFQMYKVEEDDGFSIHFDFKDEFCESLGLTRQELFDKVRGPFLDLIGYERR